jgi:hypothetical protein
MLYNAIVAIVLVLLPSFAYAQASNGEIVRELCEQGRHHEEQVWSASLARAEKELADKNAANEDLVKKNAELKDEIERIKKGQVGG